ncbi:MAG: purine-binding chemotaxis protein CheW [Lachnospiraceae bacterium]|jgi:purine-binding chemotaxis protein CheW|nr:purine-binding chemotaxis protein CheW [Lachnospiraceae bacterium]MCI9389666.1 purine-binding chemotaxis protein CheW [Lachnospiraceae bacterium]MCI9470325.1 purine-binding chemotaxis protein CheW [Lachnospiraceae bacterium]
MSEDTKIIIDDDMDEVGEIEVEKERFLTFRSADLTFAVNTKYVIEIITNHSITTLPMVPEYIKGIINLRGQIIPIVDIRLRLGKPSIDMENNESNCIIVLDIDSISVGIIVDSVSQVVDSELSKISPVPVNNQRELVNGMISLDVNNVVLLLDCEQLVDTQTI